MPPLDDPSVRAALDDEPSLPRMSFGDHLDELRRRLVISLIAIFVAMFAVLPFKSEVQEIIIQPYRIQWRRAFENWVDHLEQQQKDGSLAADKQGERYLAFCHENEKLILSGTYQYPWNLKSDSGFPMPYELFAMNGLEDMFAYMFAAMIFALVLASPIVIWQVWAFVAAGLYPKERRLFYRFFPFMASLMVAGVLFGYRVALPFSLGFLLKLMNPDQVGAMLSIGQFLNLLFALTAAMGLVFQLPLVMVALQRVGLVRHAAFVKHWRITVLIIFIAAAIFTPPEPVSMMLMATPMLLLYGLGLALTRAWRKHETKWIEVAP